MEMGKKNSILLATLGLGICLVFSAEAFTGGNSQFEIQPQSLPCENAVYRSPTNNLRDLQNELLHPAAIIGVDDRVEVEKTPATVGFQCGDRLSQATFVTSDDAASTSKDVVIISAHAIYGEDCDFRKAKKKLANCYIRDVNDNDTRYKIDMKSFISGPELFKSSGGVCNFPKEFDGNRVDRHKTRHDFVVLRIKDNNGKLPNVAPYRMKKPTIDDLGQAYTLITSSAKNAKDKFRPSVQAVTWRNNCYGCGADDFLMKTDADTGGWMSGASMLDGDGNFVGMHIMSTKEVGDGQLYDQFRNFSLSIPVTDNMITAVKMVSETNSVISQK